MGTSTDWDAVIIGGGAAGLSAGIVLARTGIRVVLVENRTPRNAPAAHLHGFLSRDGMRPGALLQAGREEMTGFGGKILTATVDRVRKQPDGQFCARLDDGSELVTPAVLLATGLRDILPAIPGVADMWGELVHHCPHCHGSEVAGQRVAVIGGLTPQLSLHQAALMRRYTDAVTLYLNGIQPTDHERARLTAAEVTVIDQSVTALSRTNPGPLTVELADGTFVAHDCAFVVPSMTPRDDAFEELGLDRVDAGPWIVSGSTGRTSVDGVWVAGNLSNPRAQVVTAAGEGSAAAIDVSGYLLERDLEGALTGKHASWYRG